MAQTTDTEIREVKELILGLDKKIDALDKKVEVSAARTEERLKALETQAADFKKSTDTQLADLKKNTDTQLADIRVQLRSQDNRLWTFIVALFLAVFGFAAKLILFPGSQT
ncbi:MAG: hypothetical protein HC851_01925 [Acaryochloris sp. RU_4_1]|nr:hypothetical protein [Acaryochloris sp. RU_4_1]NJR53393.1 hypothetical protein [Acaryochloris sp. CRU_2_0]